MGNAVVRWITKSDMPSVLEIESHRKYPWSLKVFEKFLGYKDCMGIVAEKDGEIFAFAVYMRLNSRFEILNLAVSPGKRRQRTATKIIEKFKSKLDSKLNEIWVMVRESNTAAQLFFKSAGFTAVSIRPAEFWDEQPEDENGKVFFKSEDGYQFEYVVPANGAQLEVEKEASNQ